ncbi:hypothetical protein [Azotobacter salinestris]|uniref:hypothetical protein n=1 Tax=Azotobacter salinestris TaxID=69964 RepID=UPI0032DE4927
MENNYDGLTDLLAHYGGVHEEIKRTAAEFAAEIDQRHRLIDLADQLEQEFGPALLTREELLAWLAEQIEAIKAAGVTDGNSATEMIDNAYLELLIDDAYLGPMLGWPSIH